jgi:rare lipoprotein A
MHGRPLTSLVLCLAAAAAAVPAAGGTAREPRAAVTPTAGAHGAQRVRRAQHGKISWYGNRFKGQRTASGERYDPRAMTMAHRTLPLGAIVEVTNNANGRHVRLRVNDRGPYRPGRVGDVSRAASQRLDFVDAGVTDATIRVVSVPGPTDIAS